MRYTKKAIMKIVCPDGTEHDTLQAAQEHDVDALLIKRPGVTGGDCKPIASYIVAHSSEVLDILLTDGRSRKRLKTPAKPRKKSAHERAGELLDAAALAAQTKGMQLDAKVS